MSEPPRPRPRPRPVAKNLANSNARVSSNTNVTRSTTDENSNASSSPRATPTMGTGRPSPSQTRRVLEVKDTDEMFMRNRNRSHKTWQKLEMINRETNAKSKSANPGSDSDGGEDLDTENANTPRRNRNKKRRSGESGTGVHQWQNDKNLTRLLSAGLSDSDSDVECLSGSGGSPSHGNKNKRKRHHGRSRSRSKSITPPPALPLHQIQNARDVVRKTLNSAPRPASPPLMLLAPSAPDADLHLQPELSAIAEGIIAERSRIGLGVRRGQSQGEGDGVGSEEDHIVITIKWHPHPLDVNGTKAEWQYKIERNDTFRELFEATSEDAEVLVSNLIMTYQGNRFFPSVTPQTLKIWTNSCELDAYEKTAYEYIQKQQSSARFSAPQSAKFSSTATSAVAGPSNSRLDLTPRQGGRTEVINIDSDDDDRPRYNSLQSQSQDYATKSSSYPPQTQTQAYTETQDSETSDAEPPADDDGRFKLILRSSLGLQTKDVTLVVRPTTKCGAIVRAFLKKAGLSEAYPDAGGVGGTNALGKGKKGGKKGNALAGGAKDPCLCIDGDKVGHEVEIGKMELEDGDMVDVVGL